METYFTFSAGVVLVVDDDPHSQRLLSEILTRASNEVLLASNAEEALEICRNRLPDVVLLDVMMPGIDGVELCGMMRQEFAEIPIIMISGHSDEHTCSKTITKGANDFLVKPIRSGEVLIRVKNAMQVRHLQTELEHQEAQLEEVSHQYQEWASRSGEDSKQRKLNELLECYATDEDSEGLEFLPQ